MKYWILALFCVGTLVLHGEDSRDRDLRCVLEKSFLTSDQLLNMFALEASQAEKKTIDSKKAVAKFKKQFFEETAQEKFREIYSIFTDEEMKEIRKIHENPAFQKYMQETGKTFPQSFAIIREMFREIALQDGVAKDMKSLASPVLEITQANFQQEVKESMKPLVVIDFYSSSCPPCRMMEPILEELSQEFDSVQFVKVNCGTEFELAQKYRVTRLPTFLFIKPGQEDPAGVVMGFTPKEVFEQKIAKFLSLNTGESNL